MSNHSFESQKREKKLFKMPINSLAEGESGGKLMFDQFFVETWIAPDDT